MLAKLSLFLFMLPALIDILSFLGRPRKRHAIVVFILTMLVLAYAVISFVSQSDF